MDCADCDEAHEVGEGLVVSGCDAPELFELVEEALARHLGGETVDQVMGEGDVVALSGSADQAQRQSKGFGSGGS